jgi:hypothetical protein
MPDDALIAETTNSGITDLSALLRQLEPVRNPGEYIFTSSPLHSNLVPGDIIASIREPEGMSVILERSRAQQAGIAPSARFAWITLTVRSSLHAKGLTAAIATALARADISCNVIAGAHHDHIFVPIEEAAAAMTALRKLQRAAA